MQYSSGPSQVKIQMLELGMAQRLIIFSHFCLSLSLSHLYLYPCVSPSCPSLLSISPSITSISPSFSLPPSALYICISPSLHLPFSSFLSLSLFPLLFLPSSCPFNLVFSCLPYRSFVYYVYNCIHMYILYNMVLSFVFYGILVCVNLSFCTCVSCDFVLLFWLLTLVCFALF